jgi:metal-responsive CopG/Arc/MetJ family transcriptional regulator
MSRQPDTKRTGKGRRQLYTRLPEQLVIAFNQFCIDSDIERRDDLIEHVLRRFLNEPRKPPRRAGSAAERAATDRASALDSARSEVEMLVEARRHAEAILDLTAMVGRRRTS